MSIVAENRATTPRLRGEPRSSAMKGRTRSSSTVRLSTSSNAAGAATSAASIRSVDACWASVCTMPASSARTSGVVAAGMAPMYAPTTVSSTVGASCSSSSRVSRP